VIVVSAVCICVYLCVFFLNVWVCMHVNTKIRYSFALFYHVFILCAYIMCILCVYEYVCKRTYACTCVCMCV
jgi:hypothetical protein